MQKMVLALFGAGMVLAGAAVAEPISGKAAQKLMFSTRGAEVVLMTAAGLTPEDSALLGQVVKDYAYYAAAAIAPDEVLLESEATTLVANHHSVEAATAAALAGCNKLRKTGAPCVVAAVVRPKNWEPRALQLSVEGTDALKDDYAKKGTRAMAISAQAGVFALAKGASAQAAAVAACTEKGASDCAVVVADAE